MEERNTSDMVSDAQGGDREALEALFERCYPDVLQAVRFKLGRAIRGRLDSLDLTQSVYADAYRDLGQFAGKGSFRGWLLRIVENKIRDRVAFHKARKRDMGRDVAIGDEPGVAHSDDTPSKILLADEARERLEAAMDELSPEHREVIVHRHYLDLSWREVGERMKRSEAAAKMLFQRAIARLKELYDPVDD